MAVTSTFHIPDHQPGQAVTLQLPMADMLATWINTEMSGDGVAGYFSMEQGKIRVEKKGFLTIHMEENVQVTGVSVTGYGQAQFAKFFLDFSLVHYDRNDRKKTSFTYEHELSVQLASQTGFSMNFVADKSISLFPVDEGDYFRIELRVSCDTANASLSFILNDHDHMSHFDERITLNHFPDPFIEQVLTGSQLVRWENTYLPVSGVRLLQSEWANLSMREKDEQLLRATTILDDLPWLGEVKIANQRLAWPRKKFDYYEPRDGQMVTVQTDTIPERLHLVVEAIILHNLQNPTTSDIGSLSIGDISVSKSSRQSASWEYMLDPLLKSRNWWIAW